MKRFVWGFVGLLLAGCGGDDEEPAPGEELGPCVQEQFCESPLQCVNNVCVDPDQLGGTDDGASASGASSISTTAVTSATTSTTGTSASDTTTADDGIPPTDSGGSTIYCSQDDQACLCGFTADFGPPGTPCSTSTVSSPALCCGTEGWPNFGGCSCWTQSCRIISFDTCFCGIGDVDPEDTAVSTCTAKDGVCCADNDGGTCSCHEGLSLCLDDATIVSSCAVDDLHCGDSQQVEACN